MKFYRKSKVVFVARSGSTKYSKRPCDEHFIRMFVHSIGTNP